MRVSSSIVLAFFGAVASVYASSEVPDVAAVGVLPAFLKYQSMYASGDHSSKVTSQLKSLGAKLDSQGSDLSKILGSDAQSMDILDMIDSHLSLLDAGLDEDSLKTRSSDDDEDCDEDKIAAPGKVEQFISLNKKLSSKNASKDSDYKKDLKKLHKLGRQLKKQGSKLDHVVGTSKFGKAVTHMVDHDDDDADVETLEKVVESFLHVDAGKAATASTEKRDSGIAAPGKVEQFIALNQKLASPDAHKSSTYQEDLKKFQKLGKQLKKEGAKIGKIIGNSHTAVAMEKLVTDVASDVKDIGAMVTELLTDLLKRGDAGIAAPGKVEQFIALNQKLAQPDASKSSTYEDDLKKFQKLGKQLKKEDTNTEKILGTFHTGIALEKLMTDVGSDVKNLGGMVTEMVSDLLKRGDAGIAAPGKVEQFIALNQKLSQPDASKSSTYDQDVKKFQKLGKELKKDGPSSTDKALGTSKFATAAKKVIDESETESTNLGSLLTDELENLGFHFDQKRDVLADLVGDLLPSVDNLKKLGQALTNKEALNSPHYEKSLKNLKKIGLDLKKQGKDPKSLVGTGDQAEALAEMFNQAGDKTSDVRDPNIPILSGRSFHGDAHSHAAMARRRAHSHGLEN